MCKMEQKHFTVVIEQDEDGYYVVSAPSIRGCHTQGKTIDEAIENIKEAIELCLEVEQELPKEHFIGVQQVTVSAK